MPRSTQLTGAAGEYLVAAMLCQRGWAASVTPRNVPRTDVLAHHLEADRLVAIQVKTASAGYAFRLSDKAETPPGPPGDHWFVLVALLPEEDPRSAEFFILPAAFVAGFLYVDHRQWLQGRKRGGGRRKDTSMRAIRKTEIQPYRERWDLLLAPEEDAPYLLPERLYRDVKKIGLPPGLQPNRFAVSPD